MFTPVKSLINRVLENLTDPFNPENPLNERGANQALGVIMEVQNALNEGFVIENGIAVPINK